MLPWSCYATGVREEWEAKPPCVETSSRQESRVYRPDGSLCYTRVIEYRQFCGEWSETWLDGAGQVLATGVPVESGHAVIFCRSGESAICDGTGPECVRSQWLNPAACSPGACP